MTTNRRSWGFTLLRCRAFAGITMMPGMPGRGMPLAAVWSRSLSKGVDAWWLDATEPNLWSIREPIICIKTCRRGLPGAQCYTLAHSRGIYEHQRQAIAPAGIYTVGQASPESKNTPQPYGQATPWYSWHTFRRQIADGLQYSLSGLPTGHRHGGFMGDLCDSRIIGIICRWFSVRRFCPVFRAMEQKPPEVWALRRRSRENFDRYLILRYRLMPYIYRWPGRLPGINIPSCGTCGWIFGRIGAA